MPDPYLLPNGTLQNKVGAVVQDELSRLEADIVAVREAELLTSGIAPPFDIDKLRWVHLRLFRDVYDWAGMFRTVNLRKGSKMYRTRFPASSR